MIKAEIKFTEGFEVLLQNNKAQAAQMTLAAGDSTGGPDNKHEGSDQWLFVVEGEGEAIIEGQKKSLQKHTLVLIEAGESHEIHNTGNSPLRTFNLYVPPEY